MKHEIRGGAWTILLSTLLLIVVAFDARGQERLSVSYAALGGANSIWNIAKEAGFYQRRGLDVEAVYIGSTALSAAAVLSGHIQVGMVAGVGVINSVAAGADLVSVACFVNVLDYELVAQPSIKSAEGLKGKTVGISRFGSVTDMAARVFLAELKLRPGDDVIIRQVGGARKSNPNIKVTVNDVVDDIIARELEKEGFFDRLCGKK